MQESYSAGGHKAELVPLLERCTRELQGVEKYKTDVRYLRVWLQYVSAFLTRTEHLRASSSSRVMQSSTAPCSSTISGPLIGEQRPRLDPPVLPSTQADCLPEPRDVFNFLKVAI